ncbi:unnamed protein product [Symbiodinium sp. KB8]|nr:unnamed protein product [Symbiodinium sp. KB8]
MAIRDARESAEATLANLREAWSSLSEQEIQCAVRPEWLRFAPDTKHKLQHSSPYIEKLMQPLAPAEDCEVEDPWCRDRAEDQCLSHAMSLEAAKETEDADIVTALFDAERPVCAEAWHSAVTIHAPDFRRLLASYIDTSGAHYDRDPQGQSRRILVVATMVLMIDRAACAQFPLLEEHSLGIDMNMLHVILAPHLQLGSHGKPSFYSFSIAVRASTLDPTTARSRHERKILQSLEAYAHQRNSAACPSTADPCVSDKSFGVKFAKSNLQGVRARIQQECKRNQERKKEEIEAAVKRHSALLSRAEEQAAFAGFACRRAYGGTYETHSPSCRKCEKHRAARQYRSQADQIDIAFYEKLLPEAQDEQHAVVYELQQPDLLALQRDAILLFAREIGVPEDFYSGQQQALWNEDPCLQKWRTLEAVAFSLGSTRRKFCQTHYRQAHVLSHPSFVVPHGYNIVLAGDKPDENDNDLVSATLKWNVEPLVKLVTDDVRYQVLDKHVSGWKRNENQAIALKSEAHVDISLLEFETFGGLRSGLQLQIPRLMCAVAQHSLTFYRLGVLNMVKALLWQVGPPLIGSQEWPSDGPSSDPEPAVLREAARCLVEDELVLKLCMQIGSLLDRSRENWTQNRTLLFVVHVARFLAEHSRQGLGTEAHNILLTARRIGIDWLQRLRRVVQETTDITAVADLRNKIVDVAATTTLTFVPKPCVGAQLPACMSADAFVDWLRVRAACFDNILLGRSQEKSMPRERRLLLRHAMCVALSIEHDIHGMSLPTCLTEFSREHWGGGRDGIYGVWTRCPAPAGRWYRVPFQLQPGAGRCTLHVDVLRGSFLVNGNPVQPAPDGGYTTGLLDSVYFGFALHPDGTVLVTEKRYCTPANSPAEDGTKDESECWQETVLVPHEAFKGDAPADLINKYSHWLVKKPSPAIYFRPTHFQEPKFALGCSETGSDFVLDLEQKQIKDTESSLYLIDICSETFGELFNVFGRVAPRDRVHVFACDPRPLVFLPALHMRFHVEKKTGRIESHELGGYVASNQNLGTLIGLEHGLLLETNQTNHEQVEQVLLLPHAKASRTPDARHCTVSLTLSELRSPPFFVYTLRPQLCELRGQTGRLPWIYLAKLHALTSHVLPDPFLQRTGTAAALSLLRSARCRGNLRNSLDEKIDLGRAEKTFLEIAELSATRSFYPDHLQVMEVVDFHGMPGLCAHEGFAFLARDALLEVLEQRNLTGEQASKKLEKAVEEMQDRCSALARRAYLRSREVYGLPARLEPEEEDAALQGPWRPWAPAEWQEEDHDRASLRQVALVCLSHCDFPVSPAVSLQDFLRSSEDLKGYSHIELEAGSLVDWYQIGQNCENMRLCWVALYQAALRCENRRRFDFFLAYLARKWPQHVVHLQVLSTIAIHQETFSGIELPPHQFYTHPDEHDLDRETVRGIIKAGQKQFDEEEPHFRDPVKQERASREHQQRRSQFQRDSFQDLSRIEGETKRKWLHGGEMQRFSCAKGTVKNPELLAKQINAYLIRCRQAWDLRNFLEHVETKLQELKEDGEVHEELPEEWDVTFPRALAPPTPRESMWLSEPTGVEVVKCATLDRLWETGQFRKPVILNGSSRKTRAPTLQLSPDEEHAMINKQLLDPLRESWEMAHTKQPPEQQPTQLPTSLKTLALFPEVKSSSQGRVIGAYAICLRAEQRTLRCLRLADGGEMSSWLARELHPSSVGCTNWKPTEHPEWLLLEVDNDFCIREQQVSVAKSMMFEGTENPEDMQNRLMQLNMGEGKTSVIVPLLIASLADGKSLLRVTVLSSLRHSNATEWQHKLGGLLGHRLHPMFCRRDLKLEESEAQSLHSFLDRVRLGRDVIVTVPEHRLSFENKALEMAYRSDNKKIQTSQALHSVLDFLKMHVRDVLDESDEILHAKYQLIYTLGNPGELDGGRLRWRVASCVLASVAHRAEGLAETFGKEAVEFVPGTPDYQYPTIRLLDHDSSKAAYEQLCRWIVEDVLGSEQSSLSLRICGEEERQAFKECALEVCSENKPWTKLHGSVQPVAYVLRGLLCHNVLRLVLGKRWRVEFGAHPSGRCRMAVPYRAKDVAAERTEFGHPDVAIMLTLVTYYRGGLDKEAMEEVFRRLHQKNERQAAATYRQWTCQMRASMPTELREWSGVNLDDRETLHKKVFPAKQFPQKLVATPWDSCSVGRITTGFSGTDDARLLLPTTIQQCNLQELAHTNGLVLRNLMRKENQSYRKLPHDAAGREILEELMSDRDVNVLLDAGALVIDKSNQELAEEWLKTRRGRGLRDKEAAIFFNANNTASVVNEFGKVMSLSVSPYERSLDKCLLYLDDVHCRGCDFRMPKSSRAIVTLGRGMQKDKLVQACMRMRLLGNGHAVAFLASFEVDLQVQTYLRKPELQDAPIVASVPSWCLTNTAKAIAEKLPYWASQGAARIRKEAAYAAHANLGLEELPKVAGACAEDEVLLLEAMYGHARAQATLPQIVREVLRRVANAVNPFNKFGDGTRLRRLGTEIQARVQALASDVTMPSGMLDEEQERELEAELEEERQLDRPGPAEPCNPHVSPGVWDLATTGRTTQPFRSIAQLLQRTSFPHKDWALVNVKVTPDFIATVTNNGVLDSYLRPALWLLQGHKQQVLISNYEAEAVASCFSTGRDAKLVLVGRRLRPHQAPVSDVPLPTAVHVFAGSLYGKAETSRDSEIEKQRSFLGISWPVSKSEAWTDFYTRQVVERDGFVAPVNRARVSAEDPSLTLEPSPFASSPVRMLRRLLGARHLGGELPFAPLGMLLCTDCDD